MAAPGNGTLAHLPEEDSAAGNQARPIAGHATEHLAAYHLAFVAAAALALAGVAAAATIKDADAANTITGRRTVAVPAHETGDELTARANV